MSRRGRSGPSVSLFAFQDIITSVTAILIVIVLLLVLDLVQRKEARGNPLDQMATELKVRLEALQAEMESLQAKANAGTTAVEQVADITEASLESDIETLEAKVEQLTAAIKKSKERLIEIEPQLMASEALLTATEHLKSDAESLASEANDIQADIKELQSQDRTIFTAPRGYSGNGWVMVIEGDRIQVAPLGRPMVPITFQRSQGGLLGTSLAQQFVDWNRKQTPTIGYWLLLIRPNGSDTFDILQDKFDRQGATFGFDLIDSRQMILHPERGAVP